MSEKKRRYRLYVDESGDHTYGQMDCESGRFLALLGIWFRQDDAYRDFVAGLATLKKIVFGDDPDTPVSFHRKEIVNKRGVFSILRDEDIMQRFNNGFLSLVRDSDFRLTCVVIDKLEHRERYSEPIHPYDYCLAALLDRYCGWLNYKNAVGDVLAEQRGKTEDKQLNEAYRHIRETGTLMFPAPFHSGVLTSRKIKFRKKEACVPGLELADLLAFDAKRAMLLNRGKTAQQPRAFHRDLMQAIEPKFNHKGTHGRVRGYGKVWL